MRTKILTCFNLEKCFLHTLCTQSLTWYTLKKIKLKNVIRITLTISEILTINHTINALIIRIQIFFMLLFSIYTSFNFKLHLLLSKTLIYQTQGTKHVPSQLVCMYVCMYVCMCVIIQRGEQGNGHRRLYTL
jgi:hypothetical protein